LGGVKMQKSKDNFINYMNYYKLKWEAIQEYNKIIEELKSDDYGQSRIFKLIDDRIVGTEKELFENYIEPDTVLYRARLIDWCDLENGDKGIGKKMKEDGSYETMGYNEINSVECPLGRSDSGRNNIAGMSYLYLAENPETACAEIKTNLQSFISLGEFCVKQRLRILNLSSDKTFTNPISEEDGILWGMFITLIMCLFTRPVLCNNDYSTTQIISDYFRKMGYDGISYKSGYTFKDNYTIFNSHKSKIEFVKSKVLYHYYSQNDFWDFNEGISLSAQNQDSEDFNKKIIYDILKNIPDMSM
jgi:hypothetical protein